MITASLLFMAAAFVVLANAASVEFRDPADGIIMKAEGDGGSNSGSSDGGFGDIDYDLPF